MYSLINKHTGSFLSTALISTGRVRHINPFILCSLFRSIAELSINLSDLGTQRIKPGAAEWEGWTLPLCNAHTKALYFLYCVKVLSNFIDATFFRDPAARRLAPTRTSATSASSEPETGAPSEDSFGELRGLCWTLLGRSFRWATKLTLRNKNSRKLSNLRERSN